jgi:hypothetical protein
MKRLAIAAAVLLLLCNRALAASGYVENPQPNTTQSGITLISGWTCAPASVTASIDGGPLLVVPFGGERVDTVGACGGQVNNGFGLLYNYNRLTPGSHTIRVFVNGAQLGTDVPFTVQNLGGEFLEGLQGRRYLDNFPGSGQRAIVDWQQSKQNFGIVGMDTMPPLAGTYYGASVFTFSGCPSGNGPASATGQYSVGITNGVGTIFLTYGTGGTCTFRGNLYYYNDGGEYSLEQATYSCSDGTTGKIELPRIFVTPHGFTYEFTQYLPGSCKAAGRGGGVRF